MKLQQKIGFHNKFELKVVRDGEVIQEGYAENIILDRMYTKLCPLALYWGQIVYGRGTGTLDATRTTLFNRIGNAVAVVEERKMENENTLSITRKATLGLTVSNGETITEIGISEHTTNINTHALITDSEGNPISITKTDLDVVYIYSTVYIELISNNYLTLSPKTIEGLETYNSYFADYLAQETTATAVNVRITYIEGSKESSDAFAGLPYSTGGAFRNSYKAITPVSNTVNKKSTFSFRIEVGDMNPEYMGISDLAFQNAGGSDHSIKIKLVDSAYYSGHEFTDRQIGVGNGVKKVFPMHRSAETVSVKVDGVDGSGVDYHGYARKIMMSELFDVSGLSESVKSMIAGLSYLKGDYSNNYLIRAVDTSTFTMVYLGILPIKPGKGNLNGLSFIMDKPEIFNTSGARSYLIEGSTDGGVTFFEIVNQPGVSYNSVPVVTIEHEGTLTHVRLSFGATKSSGSSSDGLVSGIYFEDFSKETEACLIFDTPPADGAIITASYKVPYIPKDENHVIDIDLELVWGEGTV